MLTDRDRHNYLFRKHQNTSVVESLNLTNDEECAAVIRDVNEQTKCTDVFRQRIVLYSFCITQLGIRITRAFKNTEVVQVPIINNHEMRSCRKIAKKSYVNVSEIPRELCDCIAK